MNIELYPHQVEAIKKMHNGCILYGPVGSGKSRTALAYTYICELGGSLMINGKGVSTKPEIPKDLYIITTAKKRDTLEWDQEVAYFCLPTSINVKVDSWNSINKYKNVYGAMFIFDEQRVVGRGAWVKAFLKIARKNHWILLSGTPGDTWSDYIPVMVANGYYKNRTQFNEEHVVFKPYMSYPVIDRYVNTKKLQWISEQILVKMEFNNGKQKHVIEIPCEYNRELYKNILKNRWNYFEDEPIENTGTLCYLLRRVCNDDKSRYLSLEEILKAHPKVIIFYNFNYELDALKALLGRLRIKYAQWNGQVHEDLPKGEGWAYLCQYTASSEGWCCVTTDTIVFFSQNYSYKTMIQAAGRVDRLNSPYNDLYYYHLISSAPIDIAIRRSLKMKKNFNERIFMKGIERS